MTCAEPVIGCELNALPVSETSCTEVVCGEWVAEDWNQVWDHNRFTPKVHSDGFFFSAIQTNTVAMEYIRVQVLNTLKICVSIS